ncbi:hypothetical protein [Flaviaesturariibacter amylovorans]|uniref:Uncharacterized protein n=1 Tax=Flaviaesturariibacter amylovorans TaxID=1084520 RepID=A0ABP8HI75_9BACT
MTTRYALLDTSLLIWDKESFEANRPSYYRLMSTLPSLFDGLIKYNVPILLKGELGVEVFTSFPYDKIPNEHISFQTATLNFLSKANFVDFTRVNGHTITSDPNQIKGHFNDNVKEEVQALITYIHADNQPNKWIITHEEFWPPEKESLLLRNSYDCLVERFEAESEKDLYNRLGVFKRLFDHHNKHDAFNSGGKDSRGEEVSGLSCYNERDRDTTSAQDILDKAFEFEGMLLGYDRKNGTYVEFRHTTANLYHAHDVKLDKLMIQRIKKQYPNVEG